MRFDSKLEGEEEDEETPYPAEPGPSPEEAFQASEIWKLIKLRLKDEKEYTVVYASFVLALSSREILAEFPGVFRDIDEIYQCTANVKARLRRDPEVRDLFN